MKIKLTQRTKIELLRAIKEGEFDTRIFPELEQYEPAKLLSVEQAKEFIKQIEESC